MPNLALLSIPAYFLLSLSPHFYAFTLTSSTPQGPNNKNPHGSTHTSSLRTSLGPAKFEKWERAESAHRNNLENAPLFVAAVLATVLAEKVTPGARLLEGSVGLGSQAYAGTWLALRVMYNFLYINTESESVSHLRSLTWMAGTLVSFYQIWSSAVALA